MYGAGGICDSVKAIASGLYLLFFYTTVMGLPGTWVGLAAAIGLLWDALCDPIVGRLSDRSLSTWGRRHGWMAAGSAGMAVSFVALFSAPAGLSTGRLFTWLLATSLLLRTSHSMFAVPYYAFGTELDTSYDGRTAVAAYRAAAVQVGAIMASGMTTLLFFSGSEGSDARLVATNYSSMALALGLVMGTAGMVVTIGTWASRATGDSTSERLPAGPRPRSGGWRSVASNRPLRVLTAATSAYLLATVLSAVLSLYFLTHYAAIASSRVIGACQFALYGGAAAGIVGWAVLGRGHDKRRLFGTACVLLAITLAGAFWVAAPGALPEGVRLAALVLGHAAVGATASGPAVLAPSMLADVAAAHTSQSGDRAEGTFFGMFSAGQQVATGVAVALAGPLVDRYAGLVPGSTDQSLLTVFRLGVLTCVLPGALALAAGGLILGYPLTTRRVPLVERDPIGPTCAH